MLALGSADVAAVGAVGVQLGPGLGIGDAKLGLLVTASSLWGRAEGVRTAIRSTLEAFAPLIFGLVAEGLGAGAPTVGPSGSALASTTAGAGQVGGLELAFILMLVPLAAAGVLLLVMRRRCAVDVASAAESERRARVAARQPAA